MVDTTLVDFVKALRTAELKVSPAETLDANNELRVREQDLVRTLLAMVDQLKA